MSDAKSGSKKKSNIFKDAMVLFLITLIAGFALGKVYEITKPIIDERALKEKRKIYQSVYKDAEFFLEDDKLSDKASRAGEELFTPNGLGSINVEEVLLAQDSSGKTIGHVISISTAEGFGGAITISLGYSLDGTVQGLEFLVINETVGYGQNATNADFIEQFVGKQVSGFVVSDSGLGTENAIDGLTGATITTNAVANLVNAGLLFLNEVALVGN